MSLKEIALRGRQVSAGGRDMMSLSLWTLTRKEWAAYITGFYRGAGYSGSGNRGIRQQRNITIE